MAFALPYKPSWSDVRIADGGQMKQFQFVVALGFVIAAAAPAMAQQQQSKDSAKKSTPIPADARPPKGMCRVWIDGVPAAQQPAATDCASAVKNRPTNGRVIFGDDFRDSAKTNDKAKLPPSAKGFQGVKPPAILLPKRP
jgi:hypothetical protein